MLPCAALLFMELQPRIRIGTRDSKLALWQANQVKEGLEQQGISCSLVAVKSEGDLDLVTPLYAMGVEGVFTKTLDAYLLSNRIDIAVHSMKDVPIQLAEGIDQAAVLHRASHKDILLAKDEAAMKQLQEGGNAVPAVIATGSVRRRAQWLRRYPAHTIESLRGNVQTRLQKLRDNNWHGALFAAAGLERLAITTPFRMELGWMLPAPAQGAIMVVCRREEEYIKEQCAFLNDALTALCVKAERDFLSALMGGCSTPISALATVNDKELLFKGNILSPDGRVYLACEETYTLEAGTAAGRIAAEKLRREGADKIIDQFKRTKNQ